MIKVTQFLIEKGAPLNVVNSEQKTAFAMALDSDNVNILDILADSVKLSECPHLFFTFKQKIYDDRYKSVLIKLLKRETSADLTPKHLNTLDSDGFTPFLAFIRSFVENRDDLMSKVGRELAYQEYQHKDRTENYTINNIDLFKSKA